MFYMDPVNGSIKFMRSRTKPEEGHWECSYLIKLIEVGRPPTHLRWHCSVAEILNSMKQSEQSTNIPDLGCNV